MIIFPPTPIPQKQKIFDFGEWEEYNKATISSEGS